MGDWDSWSLFAVNVRCLFAVIFLGATMMMVVMGQEAIGQFRSSGVEIINKMKRKRK